jgi:DNA-directed RNA polymerase sigma subunit (sigma70/sigma32)
MSSLHPLLQDIGSARKRRDRGEQDLRANVVYAFNHRDGYTVEDIAEAAGLTRERIYQIVKET